MSRAKTDTEVLSPEPVEVVIGGRKFIQKPLALRGTASLITALGEELQNATSSPALGQLLSTDIEQAEIASLVPSLLQLISSIPNAVPRIVTIILTGDDKDEETMAFIDENCHLVQAMRILRTFIDQNEPEELIENFIVLRSTLTEAVGKAKQVSMAT